MLDPSQIYFHSSTQLKRTRCKFFPFALLFAINPNYTWNQNVTKIFCSDELCLQVATRVNSPGNQQADETNCQLYSTHDIISHKVKYILRILFKPYDDTKSCYQHRVIWFKSKRFKFIFSWPSKSLGSTNSVSTNCRWKIF